MVQLQFSPAWHCHRPHFSLRFGLAESGDNLEGVPIERFDRRKDRVWATRVDPFGACAIHGESKNVLGSHRVRWRSWLFVLLGVQRY